MKTYNVRIVRLAKIAETTVEATSPDQALTLALPVLAIKALASHYALSGLTVKVYDGKKLVHYCDMDSRDFARV